MPDSYVALEDAATYEGISYDTMQKRVKRDPKGYKTKTEPQADGGKGRVLVALSSLSPRARKAHKAAQKITGRDVIIEKRTSETPWYLDVDLNWYIETHKRQYYEAVELAKRIQEFVGYSDGERTAFAAQFAGALGMSQRTLYRCAEGYLEASAWALQMEKEEGRSYDYFKVLSLCRKPKESHTFPSLTDEQKALIENIWFDRHFAANLGTIEMLYWKFEEIAKERGWQGYPSIKTVARYIKYLMDDRHGESARFLAANGTREWKNKRMLKGKRDTASLAVMEFVQGDEHTFDVWVQFTAANGKVRPVRPKLVAWVDTRTRCILGDVVCVDANSQTLKESLVKMIYAEGEPGGVPKHLHIDNGKDYTSETNTGQKRTERGMDFDSETKGFYRSIGIEEWSRSLPYEPWGKGQIERFFGTVCSRFSKWFDSYVGTLTGSKTYAKRQKDVDRMLERGELLTMEEFFDAWTKWKNEFYHKREHSALRQNHEKYLTPGELFEHAENRYVKAPPPREYAAMLLLKSDKALVRNQGIIKFGKLYTDYALCHYIGRTVGIKWDIDDVTRLYVFDEAGRKICEAVSAELLMIAPKVPQALLEEHLRDQKRQLREDRERLAEYTTPFEARRAEGATPDVVGGLKDLTIRAERPEKVIALPQDKEFREAKKGSGSKGDDTFMAQKAESALEKLRAINS